MFLILKSTFRIRFHPFFYIFLFLSLITGNFFYYVIFFSIILFHEFGHILGGLIFSWRIREIVFLPFGGLTIFNTMVNTSLLQEFIVALLGPVFQLIFYFFLKCFFSLPDFIVFYNFVLLGFNLLPIFPLDGSKFLYVFLCLIFPFKFAHLCLIFVSFVFIFIVFINSFDFIVFLILLFLFFRCVSEFRNHRYIFNRFLFERYVNDFSFSHLRKVRSESFMFKWCRHLISFNGNYITEVNYLSKRFDNKRVL